MREHPTFVSAIGALSGWVSVNLVQMAQFGAAALAALVSLCALILTIPKVIREIKSWFKAGHQ